MAGRCVLVLVVTMNVIGTVVSNHRCQLDEGIYSWDKRAANMILHAPVENCCDEGFCERNQDTCTTNAWQQHIQDLYCNPCPDGYASKMHYSRACHYRCGCEEIPECTKCKNGATCSKSGGSYKCSCSSGFEGDFCESDIDECVIPPCYSGHYLSCDNTPGSYRCNCKPGYTGHDCVYNNIDECVIHPCYTEHTLRCANTQGSYICTCKSGYTGHNCDTDIDECVFPPCYTGHYLSCDNTLGSYSCKCKPGYTGHDCETDIDECVIHPCYTEHTLRCANTPGSYICTCKSGYTGHNCETDIDECFVPTCNKEHTQKCDNTPGSYSCTCKPGYAGHNCETEINECASSPCQNGATCHDLVNMYRCECVRRFYGVNCETNICHPIPADVVFVLDSSVSMTEAQFRKQLKFISTFIDHVKIGVNDFRMSVVTFSFEAHVEFYLDAYTDNVTLKHAVENVKYRPGATFTDKGLIMADQVFEYDTSQRLNRFIFLLTDGMSSDRKSTVNSATLIKEKNKGYVFKISVIGIGNEVSHGELLKIASDPSMVYSVQDFDSLYTVLKSLVHYTCDECQTSAVSDLALIVDTSKHELNNQLLIQRALSYLVDIIDIHPNRTRVSLTSYDVKITERLGFLAEPNAGQLHLEINTMMSSESRTVEIVDVMDYTEFKAFAEARTCSKKIAFLFTNGNFGSYPDLEIDAIKRRLLNRDTTTVCVGSGSGVNFDDLSALVENVFHIYVAHENGDFSNLDALKSYLSHSTCELEGE